VLFRRLPSPARRLEAIVVLDLPSYGPDLDLHRDPSTGLALAELVGWERRAELSLLQKAGGHSHRTARLVY
jgi:hypothetical protein